MPDSSEPASEARRGVHGGEAVLGGGREVELADFPERVAARFLDPVVAFLFVLAALIIASLDWLFTSACMYGSYCEPDLSDTVRGDLQRVSLTVSLVVFGILVLCETAATRLSGQTWGKRRRRVRVVRRADGQVPSPQKAFVRCVVPAAVGASGCVGAVLADCAGGSGAVDRGVCVGDVGQERPRLARHGCRHRRHQ